jgi:hypothetical protein
LLAGWGVAVPRRFAGVPELAIIEHNLRAALAFT